MESACESEGVLAAFCTEHPCELPSASEFDLPCRENFALAFILVEALASPPTNSELAVDTIWTTNKFIQHSAALCKTKLIALGFGPAECASPHLTSPSDALTKQQHNPNIVSQQYTNRPAECVERLNGH